MQIYTGATVGEKLEQIKEYGLGIMISPSPTFLPRKEWVDISCAFDNGAFQAHQRGYPFRDDNFWAALNLAYSIGISLDFLVCPDIVGGGRRSLEYSLEWAEKLKSAPRLALVVQNDIRTKETPLRKSEDMTPEMLSQYDIISFSHLFIGGTVEWKWQTADMWVKYAHKIGLKCHIGQCGQLKYLKFAEHIQADSVDSTSFVRNGSWSIIGEYLQKTTLFERNKK